MAAGAIVALAAVEPHIQRIRHVSGQQTRSSNSVLGYSDGSEVAILRNAAAAGRDRRGALMVAVDVEAETVSDPQRVASLWRQIHAGAGERQYRCWVYPNPADKVNYRYPIVVANGGYSYFFPTMDYQRWTNSSR